MQFCPLGFACCSLSVTESTGKMPCRMVYFLTYTANDPFHMNSHIGNPPGCFDIMTRQLVFPFCESRNVKFSTMCSHWLSNIKSSISQNNITWSKFVQKPTMFSDIFVALLNIFCCLCTSWFSWGRLAYPGILQLKHSLGCINSSRSLAPCFPSIISCLFTSMLIMAVIIYGLFPSHQQGWNPINVGHIIQVSWLS